MTYDEFVNQIAASVRAYGGIQDMENAVFEAVCGADEAGLTEHLKPSDDWAATGRRNDQWARSNVPNFADASALGDWEGFDLESAQQLCQDVFNALPEPPDCDDF